MKKWSKEDCRQCLRWRSGECNKGDFGYVALIGGSVRFGGAAKLANLAANAMRSGAGVVKLAVPREIVGAVSPHLLESTLFPLSSEGGEILFVDTELNELVGNVNTVAIGMGCGTGEGVKKTLPYLLRNFAGTLIVDADGINCIAQTGTDALTDSAPKVILTPHAKEFARLLGTSVENVLADRVDLARDFADRHKVVVLLKGAATVVTNGDDVLIVERGCAGMATAGSGDVLSGILAGICGYNNDKPLEAAATAAYVNGLAGELAEKLVNPISMIASDTVGQLTQAISEIIEK